MPENEFEKQVQEKMSGLHFTPSDAVWQEVQRQIAPRKKRRAMFFWLGLLLFLLGATAWLYILSSSKQAAVTKFATRPSVQNNVPGAMHQSKFPLPLMASTSDSAVVHIAHSPNHTVAHHTYSTNRPEKIATVTNKSLIPPNPLSQKTVDKKLIAVRGKTASGKLSQQLLSSKNVSSHLQIGRRVDHVKSKTPAANGETATAFLREQQYEKSTAIKADMKDANTTVAIINSTDAVRPDSDIMKSWKDRLVMRNPIDTAQHKSVHLTRKINKIEVGIKIDLGAAMISQGVSGLFSTQTFDATYASVQNINSSPATPALPASTSTSKLKPGFAFGAGILFSKQIGKNARVLLALQYAYQSAGLQIGSKIDSAAAPQYRTGNTNNYGNRFHFVVLPVSIEKSLGGTSRFSVNGGVLFAVLAGSNALQYDAQKSIYHTDNNLLNKMQLGLLGGLNYRVLTKSLRIQIGPQFTYNLTNTFKKELYGSRHLLMAVLNTKIFLQKK